ncbi:hypothetical protein WUBG_01776 [Wuchereria bancrofti]|uniref:Uncharacterized protein n=1 Tax=Wuchereria bancrofti TaxID=6293 RepID=J9BIT1_WUCBA|nr:hypothetical protein WUBG_01776 [Wuchereria bancrofti]
MTRKNDDFVVVNWGQMLVNRPSCMVLYYLDKIVLAPQAMLSYWKYPI